MPQIGGEDRFDTVRRAWIAHHQGWSTIQRRRAEQLGRRVRARQRDRASAVPDPHDDTLLPPLWLRTAHSPGAHVEIALLWAVLVVVPLGLAGGYATKAAITQMIPHTLRGYPIAALLSAAATLSALTILLDIAVQQPGGTLSQVILAPWLCAQITAVPATAGVLGIAEGWLSVPASRQWFPLAPHRSPLSSAVAAEILGGYDLTGPGLVDVRRLNGPGVRTR